MIWLAPIVQALALVRRRGRAMSENALTLGQGSSIAVVGGGPAGSLCAYFLLLFSRRLGLDLEVHVYEPRDFWQIGPGGCNMCGGIVSESLVQALAVEGINLPESVVQRAIDSYVLHTEVGSCRIVTPLHEKRIAAVHRGGGPRTAKMSTWESFDAHLLKLAMANGAKFYNARVTGVGLKDGLPEVSLAKVPPRRYDLVVGAVGVNSPEVKLFEELGIDYRRPLVTKTFITEIGFGLDSVRQSFGSAMHVFLLDIPRLTFAALIPKGDYVTLCLLGDGIDRELVASFLAHPAVRRCFPCDWTLPADACHCSPKMYLEEAEHPYADRVVLVGDCGAARLYKDGIGAAFRTARAAARTAVFHGVSAEDFRRNYQPTCRSLIRDNRIGRLLFSGIHVVQRLRLPSRVMVAAVTAELRRPGQDRRVSSVLWDTFTGSASYRSIIGRTLHPAFLGHLAGAAVRSLAWPHPRAVPVGREGPPGGDA
jgi:flavin-dependent dehydrogenase